MSDGPYPFVTFNFRLSLELPIEGRPLCNAAFSECDGLESTMSPRTIREGGNNNRQIHLTGPVSYGQLSLKRGMTSDFGLWDWFGRTQVVRSLRASGELQLLSAHGSRIDVRFALTNCLPLKIKAPALSAKDGLIAIEEMQVAYESLHLRPGAL